jgi:hypothetical protein
MAMAEGQHQGIAYFATWHVQGDRLSVSAHLSRDGVPFQTISDGANAAGCRHESLHGMAVAMVRSCIDEEIRLAKSGQHAAARFLIPGIAPE